MIALTPELKVKHVFISCVPTAVDMLVLELILKIPFLHASTRSTKLV